MNTVNKPFRKKDAMQLVTGQPVYMDDLVPADCLIVKLLRSPHANAIVKSINTAAAKKVPGIEAIFTPEEGIKEGIFRSCGLFTSPDRYHTEDLIQGRVGKTDFSCAEVHAEERKTRVNSKGQTSHYWVDIFKGFLFIADFQKDFQGHTTVLRNSLFKLSFSGSRVKLENPDFEKTFDVYSTDQIEARYLLSPSMMERLLALDREFNKNITISFKDSNILIAIPESRNHFEASIWKSIDDLSQLKNDFSMIHALVSIIEDLNLNTRIWTKK